MRAGWPVAGQPRMVAAAVGQRVGSPVRPCVGDPATAAALKDIDTAIGAAREAQKSGDFAAYGAALQRLDDAINKYNNTK